MVSTSTVQPSSNVYGYTATQPRAKAAHESSTGSAGASSQVSISAAAREAARNEQDTRFKLPDYIGQWFNKDFPQDVLDEAKARLEDIKANGELGAGGPVMLPLLPENQKLLGSFRQEMKSIKDAGWTNATPAQNERFNLLMNLSARLQMVGWREPMTEADVQRELDISAVMAKLSAQNPAPPPAEDSAVSDEESAAEMQKIIADQRAGAVPSVWRQRWEKEGLEMPEDVVLSPDRSMWLDLAAEAGIGSDEFLSKLRDMAVGLKGNALTHAMERFISERYVALGETQEVGRSAN